MGTINWTLRKHFLNNIMFWVYSINLFSFESILVILARKLQRESYIKGKKDRDIMDHKCKWGICESLRDKLELNETKLFLNCMALYGWKEIRSKIKYLNSPIASNNLWGSRLLFDRHYRFNYHLLFVFNLLFSWGKQKRVA